MRTYFSVLFAFCCAVAAQSQAVAGPLSLCDNTAGNLASNCGFETGDFTSWSLSGNDVPMELGNLYGVEGTDPLDGISPNSGSNQAYFADLVSNATTLSQTIATNPGDTYDISWYLAQDTPTDTIHNYSNAFSADFGAATLTSLTALGVQGYTPYSAMAVASGSSTALSFSLGNDLGEFLIDDVVVTDLGTLPEPATWVLMLGGAMMALACAVAKSRLLKARRAR